MAKNSVRDFDATAANNTDIQSVNIAEGCAPSGINNAIRELMADMKDVSAGTIALESPSADSMTVTGDLTVDTNTLYVDSTNNNVGIGTTSPTRPLSVERDSSSSIVSTFKSANTQGAISLRGSATTSDTAVRFAAEGNDLLSFAGGSERMRILAGGGLTFNGDTAATNALDDYEEGTWIPAITQGWTSVSYTNSFQYGNYTKVGNMVTAWFFLRFSGTSAGNQVFVGGLPFTTPSSDNQAAHRGGAVTYFNVPVAAAGAITAYVAGGNNVIQFYAFDDGGASAVSNANASDDFLIGSVTYWVA